MKNALLKSALREIRHSRSRFFSILAIVAIGSGFFSGVKASCPDMKQTAATFFAEQKLADMHLLSSWGFEQEDLSAIETELSGGLLEAGYTKDLLAETPGSNGASDELVIKVISYDPDAQLNRPLLHEGRLPEAADECVIGTSSMGESHWAIGDQLRVRGDGEDLSDTLMVTTYTVVGIAQLPQYFGYSYGTTTIADGTLDGFILVPEEDFCLDVWTDVYLTLPDVADLDPFGEEYADKVEEMSDRLEALGNIRTEVRYQEVLDEANDKISDAENEIADGEKELSDAEKELSDARAELDDGWQEYYDSKAEAEQKIADAEKEIADAETELTNAEVQLADGEAQWQDGNLSYQSGLQSLSDSRVQLDAYIAQADALEAQLLEAEKSIAQLRQLMNGITGIQTAFADTSVPDIQLLDEQTQGVIAASADLDSKLPDLLSGYITADSEGKTVYAAGLASTLQQCHSSLTESEAAYQEGMTGLAELRSGIQSGEAEYTAGQAQLEASKKQLDESFQMLDQNKKKIHDGKAELEEARTKLSEQKAEVDDQLAEALQKLQDGEDEYVDGMAEYEEKKPDADQKIADAKEDIANARADLKELEKPQWYFFAHDSFPGVSTIADDAEKVDAIAAVFPVFFVLVAALVCLTTMTRMVEEQRTQIGTMKALGYGRSAVLLKYLLYASLASLCGSVLGCLGGLQLFPRVIIGCYKAMYQVPYILTPIRWSYLVGCLLVSILCTCGVTVLTVGEVMRTVPAQLMRPKSPKGGKRILLERVGFIWNRLTFSRKVTMRNLFRYKSRVLMTVIGVAGCTALLLTGFGLRHAISAMAERQYGGIFCYDSALSVSDTVSLSEEEHLEVQAAEINGVSGVLGMTMKTTDVTNGQDIVRAYLYIPSDPEAVHDFISLQDAVTEEILSIPEEGCLITEKLGKLLELSAGDTLTLQMASGEEIGIQIQGILKNYVQHYIYLSPDSYRSIYDEQAIPTTLLMNLEEGASENEVHRALLQLKNVQGVVDMGYYADAFEDLVSSLNLIVWVLIGSAAALAVIVMYNLININVSERIRELATIKVLGFTDKEVSDYICRENTAAAVLGMLVGLGLGVFLEEFVVNTAEVDVVMFIHEIPVSAYLAAAALTIFFILLVNCIVHHGLKKINMVESLKSVE